MKLYWGWAFAWDRRAGAAPQGPGPADACVTSTKEARAAAGGRDRADHRHRPIGRGSRSARAAHAWDVLDSYRGGMPADLEPLARNRPAGRAARGLAAADVPRQGLPVSVERQPHRSPRRRGWATSPTASRCPTTSRDKETREEFEKKYARAATTCRSSPTRGSCPRSTARGRRLRHRPQDRRGAGRRPRFARWLDAHPDRLWAMMMNYHPGAADRRARAQALFAKYRDRYVGVDRRARAWATSIPTPRRCGRPRPPAQTRRQLVEAFTPLTLRANAAKYRAVYGRDLDRNPYEDVISCLSVGNIAFAPLC